MRRHRRVRLRRRTSGRRRKRRARCLAGRGRLERNGRRRLCVMKDGLATHEVTASGRRKRGTGTHEAVVAQSRWTQQAAVPKPPKEREHLQIGARNVHQLHAPIATIRTMRLYAYSPAPPRLPTGSYSPPGKFISQNRLSHWRNSRLSCILQRMRRSTGMGWRAGRTGPLGSSRKERTCRRSEAVSRVPRSSRLISRACELPTHLVNLMLLEHGLEDLEVIEVLPLLLGAHLDSRHRHITEDAVDDLAVDSAGAWGAGARRRRRRGEEVSRR